MGALVLDGPAPWAWLRLAAASAAYLATLSGPEQRNTQRAYRSTLRALAAEFAPPGTPFAVADLGSEENAEWLTEWFTRQWSGRAAATFNRHLDALRSAASFWTGQGWLAADPTRRLRRRGRAPDRTRALGAAEIEALLDLDVPLREKTLWTMLYETAARSSEVLALDVEDLDRRNRRSKVTRKGSAVDVIVWQTRTARLLPRLLDGRTKGPMFLTGRRARVALSAADVDPVSGRARLSYRRAEEVFTEAALAKAESLGGTRKMGPDQAPNGLVVGHFTDPEGNLIGLATTP